MYENHNYNNIVCYDHVHVLYVTYLHSENEHRNLNSFPENCEATPTQIFNHIFTYKSIVKRVK